jgi:hypothetical protein
MTDDQFSQIVLTAIAASGKPKKIYWKTVGLDYASQFSAMLHGDRAWPEEIKQQLIELLNLESIVGRFEEGK